jgi:hypothetical protein
MIRGLAPRRKRLRVQNLKRFLIAERCERIARLQTALHARAHGQNAARDGCARSSKQHRGDCDTRNG